MDDRGKCEENFSLDEETHDVIFCLKRLIRPGSFALLSPPRAIFYPVLLGALCLSCSLRCSKNFILSFTKTVFMAFRNPTRNIISKT